MENSDDLTEAEVRRIVRDEASRARRGTLSTVLWTVVAAFTVLLGLQVVQMALYTTGVAAVALAAVGVFVAGASVYLLYLLHWGSR